MVYVCELLCGNGNNIVSESTVNTETVKNQIITLHKQQKDKDGAT